MQSREEKFCNTCLTNRTHMYICKYTQISGIWDKHMRDSRIEIKHFVV